MVPEGRTEHRYPPDVVRRDYLRAAVGLAITVPPLIFAPGGIWLHGVLGALAALFAWLGARAARRRHTCIAMDPAGIARGARRIPWAALSGLRLRRYGGRTRAGGGWIEMRLEGAGARITLDSEITGFLAIARAGAQAARAGGLALDPRTLAGLDSLGLGEEKGAQAPSR